MNTAQATRLGLIKPTPRSHEGVAASYSDQTIEAVIGDLGKRNLSNLRDHETRFLAERCKALRAERRNRKQLTTSKP